MAENSEIDPKILLMTPPPFPPEGKAWFLLILPFGKVGKEPEIY